jgi:uroporphyrinogen-III synthase
VPGFNGLRVLSFESRRAKEIAQLITNNGGVPIVAPSTREVPAGASDEELKIIRGIVAGEFHAVIFMTGVGARALLDVARTVFPDGEFEAALARTTIIVRGPKPASVMREFKIPFALAAPEPNTWREVVKVIDENSTAVPIQGRRIAIQEHGEPSPELYAALRDRGAHVFPVHVYRWELPEDTGPLKDAVRAVCAGSVDVVMFTASVQLTHAIKIAAELGVSSEFKAGLNRAVIASIGPVASDTLRDNGIAVDMEPSHPKMGFLVKETAEKSTELRGGKSARLQNSLGRL